MEYSKYLTDNPDTNLLKRFAFVGKAKDFDKKLRFLEKLAEREKWRFYDPTAYNNELNVIFYYVIHTFDRCYKQERITISADETAAAFNTGLMSNAGEEICGLFTKSKTYNPSDPRSNYWYLNGFFIESDRRFLSYGVEVPPMATYFEDYNELYFDPEKDIVINFEHIFKDNRDRLPSELLQMEEGVACQVLNGLLAHTRKKIKRNNRIPVPQFYNDKVMFLIPLSGFGSEPIVLALEEYENQYRANTVLTLNMAYNCARLLTKPESNWLLPK